MSRCDPSGIQAAVDHLRRVAGENHGKVPTEIVRATAKRFDCSERTVWNWLRYGAPAPPTTRELSDVELDAIAATQGNRKRAWEDLSRRGVYQKSYSQFARDVDKLNPITRVGLTEGVKAALSKGLYLKGTSTGRLDRVIFDHTEADIRLQRIYRGALEMYRPWVTLLLDSHTRMILACTLTEGDGIKGDPNTESLVALMASAIRGHEAADGTFVGGVPRLVQFDNAKAHLADAMLNGYLTLRIATHAIEPGSPWEDGRVERLMRTMKDEFLATLPGYTGALTDRYGHEPWKPEDCLTTEEFLARLELWVDSYNYERHHSVLHSTPFEAWREDTAPIERVPDELIRRGFLAESKPRRVSKNGVRFRSVDYVHETLGSLVGKKVSVRFLPNDRSFIDVYLDDAFLCTAVPHERLTKDERIQIVRARNGELRKVDQIVKRSRQRARTRDLEGNPLLSPERDPEAPARVLPDTSDDDFLAFVEETTGIGKEAGNEHAP